MAGRRLTLLLLAAAALLLAAGASGASGRRAGSKSSARFELIRDRPASLPELARMDRARALRRAARAGRVRGGGAAEAVAMPLSSGAYTGTGQYFVRFRVGTPAQPFLLVADTGSDLTWVKCNRPAEVDVPPAPAVDGGYGAAAPAPAGYGGYGAAAPAPAVDGYGAEVTVPAGYGYGAAAPAPAGYGYGGAAAPSVSPSSSPVPAAAPAYSAPPRAFRPDDSRTWAPIPCSSVTCKASLPFSLAACPTPGSPCAYDYRYKDGSAARGTVGTDSATVALSGRGAASGKRGSRRLRQQPQQAKLRGVVLGCTTSYNGDSFVASDGVLSLGYSNISFASRAAARFGGRFSYCLVDHLAPRNASSYLTFGPNPALSSSPSSSSPSPARTACAGSAPAPAPAPALGARQTPLLLDHRMHPFYAVTVNGISVDGELLRIPRAVWDLGKGGGAILDSGTSLTVLARPAYRAVVAALSRKLAGLPRVAMDPFDYCYNWTSPASGGDVAAAVPELAVHFAGSARLEPPAKSYVIDAAPGVKCIGLQEGDWPGVSVIGNILQQEHLWEFDLKNRRLRFKRSHCTQ